MEKQVETKFGLINETVFSLRSPRAIENDEPFETLRGALAAAAEMLEPDFCDEIAIVRCRYSRRLECWVEVVDGDVITIDARGAGALLCEDEVEDSEVAVENKS